MSPAPARRAAVLGHPISHSLSPLLHRTAYRQLGLDWSYEAHDVEEAGLGAFLASCDERWAGLSLTMPLKRAVLPLLHGASDLVGTVGSANTVLFTSAGLVGHNTDVLGIATALRAAGAVPGPAVVLGAGATAASALAGLAQLGCTEVVLHARRPQAGHGLAGVAERLAMHLRVQPWPERLPERDQAPIVVCTVPAEASAGLAGLVGRSPGWLLDVAYWPWPPPLVTAWAAAGGTAVAGDQMLLHQAGAQVALMTGAAPDVAGMGRALADELDRRRRAQA